MSSKLSPAVALCVSLMVAGCVQPTETARDPGPDPSLHLSTSVEVPPKAVAGNIVSMTLSVTNHGTESVTLHFPSTCQLHFSVQASTGKEVTEATACGAALTSMHLEPGETRRQESAWRAARYDYDTKAYVPLPPGEYRVQALLFEYGFRSQPASLTLR